MNYNSRAIRENEEMSVDSIFVYLDYIVKKWWIILLVSVLLATVGLAYARISYVPTYSSTIKFVASNRAEGTSATGASSSDMNAGTTLANNYKYLLTSTRGLMETVASDVGGGMGYLDVANCIRANVVTDTSLINFTVTTSSPEMSFKIAKSFADNYEEVAQSAFPSTTLKIFDVPYEAEIPDSNNTTLLYTLFGLILGAFISIGTSCLIVAAKDTIKASEEISEKLDLRVIGTVNHVNKGGSSKGKSKPILISDKNTGFSFVETFKLIRTKIENYAARENCKTFVVTSTLEDEGKTTISANIALALAKNGKSVLLIDGDMRKPAIHKALGMSTNGDTGILGIVNGTKSIADSIRYIDKYNLFVMLNGIGVADASEVLSTAKMTDIISAVEKEFDFVIIDSAPSGVVADTSILANFADAIIMVVKEDRASVRRIRRAMDDLSNSEKEIIGCIYNSAEGGLTSKIKSVYKGSRGKYGYGYGYNYVYGQTSKKKKK